MPIRQLPETLINQIAAGEVVERPASVVKELVENAIDAGATRVEIATAGGGLSLIRVIDDGGGMSAEDLPLALGRHCTSKLADDIFDIRSLGFRGEALPSIASVSRLTMRSRTASAESASEITVAFGRASPVRPVAANPGTLVEVADLFHATPARLKFMKGERAEAAAITETVRRIAVAFPHIRFQLSGTDRQSLDLAACAPDAEGRRARIARVLGRDFTDNSIEVDAGREGAALWGLVSLPNYTRGNALQQYVYVNGRPVRDRMLAGAIRGAFADHLPRDRHAVAALFVTIEPALVDVNVHPAKADVRFRDPGMVRGLLIGAIRQALGSAGIRPATTAARSMAEAFRAPEPAFSTSDAGSFGTPRQPGFAEAVQAVFTQGFEPRADARAVSEAPPVAAVMHPLGAARAQIHDAYIVSQTADALVIVDQHAAHERLVYEALKTAIHSRPIPSQMLLVPEIVDLAEDDADRIAAHADFLLRLGLGVERFGPGAVIVRETPSMLGETDAAQLVRDLADEIADTDAAEGLKDRLDRIAASMACHGSVRSGRRLKPQEMDALLREMEATPGSGTCNHGRPTYVELKLADIERLFARR
jgi:DNA mismatch repair protein MutL